MDAITMPSTHLLLSRLRSDFPDIRFIPGKVDRWSPSERAVYFGDPSDDASITHELAHAILGHSAYIRDVDLLKMERDAWEYAATTLAKQYDLKIDEDIIQDAIDTYRGWLHARSTCPDCQATGIQTGERVYTCIACTTTWRVNEARSCTLRRYILSE